jgi:DNA mismatch repair protein MutL
MKKNDKVNFDLKPVRELKDRIIEMYKKDWNKNLHPFNYQENEIKLSGVVSDGSLRFGSGENIKIYVNSRPVQDKIIRKALMDAYHRQITPGEYPFVVLMLEITPKLVDVNVHPAKLQVKFADSKGIYNAVFSAISEALGEKRIAGGNFSFHHSSTPSASFHPIPTANSGGYAPNENLPNIEQLFSNNDIPSTKVNTIFGLDTFIE